MDRYMIKDIPLEVVETAIENSIKRPKAKTSNTVCNGIVDGEIFYKKLDDEKIRRLYKGNYIELWKENYEILKNIIPINDIYGIIKTNEDEIYEFSKAISKDKFLSDGTIQSWNDFQELNKKILDYINNISKYQIENRKLIGIETAIWNFTIDGILFDLDPPRLLKDNENSSFVRMDDINHCKRTFYRNFTEIGMKTSLLSSIIIGLQDGNFIIKDLPNDWLDKLKNDLICSIENKKEREKMKAIFNGEIEFEPSFTKHPIDIIIKETNKQANKIMQSIESNLQDEREER